VPSELPADSYQVAVQAELLSADKLRVLATAVTPIRTLPLRLPLVLKAEGTKLHATLGAVVEVRGAVARQHGFTGDIAVSLTGLPPGVAVPAAITLKPGDETLKLAITPPFTRRAVRFTLPGPGTLAFAFKFTLPPTTFPGEVTLTLSASGVPDAKVPNVRVKARESDVVLNIIAAPK